MYAELQILLAKCDIRIHELEIENMEIVLSAKLVFKESVVHLPNGDIQFRF